MDDLSSPEAALDATQTPQLSPSKRDEGITPPLRARKFPQPQMGSSAGSGPHSLYLELPLASPTTMRSATSHSSDLALDYQRTPLKGASRDAPVAHLHHRHGSSPSLHAVPGASTAAVAARLATGENGDSMVSDAEGSRSASFSLSLGLPVTSTSEYNSHDRHLPPEAGASGSGSNGHDAVRRTPTPSTPTRTIGGINNSAVDVQGFYSQHQVTGSLLIPQELPSSQVLYVLTTSEGRDKLFKALQYGLKLAIWVLMGSKLLPESAMPLSRSLAERFASNIQTIRNGRAMFKLGRWIITLFHLQVVVERLLRKHTPHAWRRYEEWSEDFGTRWMSLVQRVSAFFGLRSVSTTPAQPLSDPSSMEASVRGATSASGEEPVAPLEPSLPCVAPEPRCDQLIAADPAVILTAPLRLSPSRAKVVTFPAHVTAAPVEGESGSFETADGDGTCGGGHSEEAKAGATSGWWASESRLLPASFSYPFRWRYSADDFSSVIMAALGTRCTLSVIRNMIRDVLFLNSKEFLHFNTSAPRLAVLQRVATKAWMAVSVIDLALNTKRLVDRGWLQYMNARSQPDRVRCWCSTHRLVTPLSRHEAAAAAAAAAASHPGRPVALATWLSPDVSFAPLDMDFGSVTPTTAKFCEAAPPMHLRPICTRCGFVLQEVVAQAAVSPFAVATGAPVQRHELFVPWLVRNAFDLVWIGGNHSNLLHTLLLELRYLGDVILSTGYAFGDYEVSLDSEPLQEHMHVVGSVAGLVSALVALFRVKLSAPSQ